MPRVSEETALNFARDYAQKEHGGRRSFAEKWANDKKISAATAYRILKTQGVLAKKKKRAGAGARMLNREQIENIASIKESSRRRTGTVTMPAEVALEIAGLNGQEANISSAYLSRLLRENKMDSRTLGKANPTGKVSSMPLERRSGYPLEWLMADVSVCLQYRFGRKGDLTFEPMNRYYGKDLKNYAGKKRALFRYAAVDHFSRNLFIHYYYAGGENADDWVDFLLRCFFKKSSADQFPFMGVPQNIYSDKGSGLNNATAKGFLEALEVNYATHMPGNPRGKGAVEVGHRLWQNYFESRLAIEPAKSLEDLNRRKDILIAEFNAVKVHRTSGRTRFEMWTDGIALIPEGKFRVLPENKMDLIRALAHRKPEDRKVNGLGMISYDGREYRVGEASLKNETVDCYPSPYHQDDVLIVLWQNEKYEAARIERDEFGFASDAVPFGEWKRAKDAAADRNLKTLNAIDHTGMRAFPDMPSEIQKITAISARLPKQEITLPNETTYVSETAAREYLRREIGPKNFKIFIVEIDAMVKRGIKREDLEAKKMSFLRRAGEKQA